MLLLRTALGRGPIDYSSTRSPNGCDGRSCSMNCRPARHRLPVHRGVHRRKPPSARRCHHRHMRVWQRLLRVAPSFVRPTSSTRW